MLKTLIFRQDEKATDSVSTSSTPALTYSQFRDCLNRLGLAAGFLEKLTSYCFRRGTANVVDRTEVEAEVRRLTAEIGTTRTRRRNIISEEYRADYFRRRLLKDIERQNSGQ
ncbi:hypothetical protein ACEPPN_002871 [Leptodophora sp. 'Broadleaf-Isolate-01']